MGHTNAANAAAAEQVADGDLPALIGSEKQINWARTIRAEKIDEVREWAEWSLAKLRDQQNPNLANAQAAWDSLRAHHHASWWIDRRTRSGQWLLQHELWLLGPSVSPKPMGSEDTLGQMIAVLDTLESANHPSYAGADASADAAGENESTRIVWLEIYRPIAEAIAAEKEGERLAAGRVAGVQQ